MIGFRISCICQPSKRLLWCSSTMDMVCHALCGSGGEAAASLQGGIIVGGFVEPVLSCVDLNRGHAPEKDARKRPGWQAPAGRYVYQQEDMARA